MISEELKKVLEKHKLWLNGEEGGERADLGGTYLGGDDLREVDLSGADLNYIDLCNADLREADLSNTDLSNADLSGADLSYADLSRADLRRANLSGADLSETDLIRANLRGANLSRADLSYANLSEANLSGVNLSGTDLSGADLSNANLSGADLSGADLSIADLSGADLSETDLSGAKIPMSADYMNENFEWTNEGYIVYKTFGSEYKAPDTWKIETDSVITENVNSYRTEDCGCGINVGTLDWVKSNNQKNLDIYKLLIKYEWAAGIVVPYNTGGKIRCERAVILGRYTGEKK